MRDGLPELVRSLRSLERPVWILVGGSFINRFGSFVFVFLALYLTSRGYSASRAGLAIGLYGVGALISTWIGGHLADRLPRRTTITVSMFGSAVVVLLLGFAEDWIPILVLSTLTGAAAELYRPASSALIIDLVPENERVTAFALNRLAINLGMALGPMAGGFLAAHSFRILFVLDSVTSLLFGIIALTMLPLITVRSVESEVHVPARIVRDGVFMTLLAAAFCVAMVIFQIGSTIPLHVVAVGYTALTYGILVSVNGWIVVTLELVLTPWTRRLDPRVPVAGGFALIGAGMFLVGVGTTLPMMIAGVVVFTLGEITAIPVSVAWVARLAPTTMRGRYMGAWTMMWAVGLIAGPAGGMWLLDHASVWLWRSCLLLGITAALLAHVSIGRQLRRRPLTIETSVPAQQ